MHRLTYSQRSTDIVFSHLVYTAGESLWIFTFPQFCHEKYLQIITDLFIPYSMSPIISFHRNKEFHFFGRYVTGL